MTRFGRYEVVSKLATGGMAEVFHVVLRGPDGFTKELAIKQMLPELDADPEHVQMFLDEARLASSLSHPNICNIFELGVEQGRHYLAMEYLRGVTLSRVMKAAQHSGRPLPVPFCAWVVARAADGLAYAHTKTGPDGVSLGIVHRDVSPDNVMLTHDGQVKVVDFGIARATQRSTRTKTGLVRGKVAWMAPEQIRGETVDARADVFALGVVLWTMLANTHPFQRADDVQTMYSVLSGKALVRPVRAGVPDELWELAEAALQRDPEARLGSARDFAAKLERLCARFEGTGPRWVEEVVRENAAAPASLELPTASAELVVDVAPEAAPAPTHSPDDARTAEQRPRTRAVPEAPARRRWPMALAALALPLVGLSLFLLRPRDLPPAALPVTAVVTEKVDAPPPPPPEPAPVVEAPVAPPAPAPVAEKAQTPKPPRTSAAKKRPRERPARPAAAEPPVTGEGTLILDTLPWSNVFLKGRALGPTPLEVKVPAGRLQLRAVTEDKAERTIEVDVKPGQVLRLRKVW